MRAVYRTAGSPCDGQAMAGFHDPAGNPEGFAMSKTYLPTSLTDYTAAGITRRCLPATKPLRQHIDAAMLESCIAFPWPDRRSCT